MATSRVTFGNFWATFSLTAGHTDIGLSSIAITIAVVKFNVVAPLSQIGFTLHLLPIVGRKSQTITILFSLDLT